MTVERANTSQVISEVNLIAIAWAKDHAGELLGTKWYDGGSSTEPSEKWPVSESVRLAVRAVIVESFGKETSGHWLVDMIQDVSGFSDEQAQMVADTEVKLAQSRGNLEAWKRTGVVKSVRWLLSSLHNDQDECDLNHEAGPIPVGKLFPSGVPGPPAHRLCRCSLAIAELHEPKACKGV